MGQLRHGYCGAAQCSSQRKIISKRAAAETWEAWFCSPSASCGHSSPTHTCTSAHLALFVSLAIDSNHDLTVGDDGVWYRDARSQHQPQKLCETGHHGVAIVTQWSLFIGQTSENGDADEAAEERPPHHHVGSVTHHVQWVGHSGFHHHRGPPQHSDHFAHFLSDIFLMSLLPVVRAQRCPASCVVCSEDAVICQRLATIIGKTHQTSHHLIMDRAIKYAFVDLFTNYFKNIYIDIHLVIVWSFNE